MSQRLDADPRSWAIRLSRAKDRDLDIVVLGATGLTGQRVLECLLNLRETDHLRIGAAGRSEAKIKKLDAYVDAPDRFQIVVTDVRKPDQLLALACRCHLILNCVGPYRHSGEHVVAACVTAGTDCMDVSGEPEFMERSELRFHEDARSSRCFIVSACGFDSIPADLGTLLVQEKFELPSSVEAFHSFNTTAKAIRVNYATWESAVHGFGSADALRRLRRKRQVRSSAHKPAGPKLRPPQGGAFDARIGAYVVPFPGSDASVVRRTQRTIGGWGKDTVHFTACVSVKSKWNLLLLGILNFIFSTLAAWQLGRLLLLSFPELFSLGVFTRRGPTHEEMQASSFSMLLIGRGYSSGLEASADKLPDREVRMEISGPDPGYIATPIFLVHAALTLLDEREDIVSRLGSGGVFTPGALLTKTRFIGRIQKAGIKIIDLTEASTLSNSKR